LEVLWKIAGKILQFEQPRTLDDNEVARELDLASELFHRINRVIPEHQCLLTIPPQTTVREAVRLLTKERFSQVPVVDGGEVLGVFSYRVFAQNAAAAHLQDLTQQKCAPGDLPVEEFLEPFEYARVTEEMQQVFEAMDRDNGVLIGSPQQLQGILTPMDFLRYLYKLASPFVIVSEIELALRALIRLAVSEEELVQCIVRSLSSLYKVNELPAALERMTLDNYQTLVCNGDNWKKFEPVLGGNRIRTSAKLKQICGLRNDLFHFRRELTSQDQEALNDHRSWLLLKVKQADVRRRAGEHV
jgi:predicted transcriptional regulator